MTQSLQIISVNDRYVPYAEGLSWQNSLHADRRKPASMDALLLMEHSPVITAGRRATNDAGFLSPRHKIEEAGIDIFDADRGGELTYHAPGQLVAYPIIELADEALERDLHNYLRNLEQVVIDTVAEFGIRGSRKAGLTGVWVGDRKVAAIGIKVSRWITMHGLALNIDVDLAPMREHIVPCGIRDFGVTSLAEEGVSAKRVDVEPLLITHFERTLNRRIVR